MITFIRRRNLGRGSCNGMTEHLHSLGSEAQVLRHWRDTPQPQSGGLVVRWGCTARIPEEYQGVTVVNNCDGIRTVNNKAQFRATLREHEPDIVPELAFPAVLRPTHHSRGRDLWVVQDEDDLFETVQQEGLQDGHYYGRLIDKAAEYRVYVVQGRVVSVAEKTPADPDAVAWNVAQGGRFDVVRFGEWPLDVCLAAIRAHNHSGLHFSGVDVMVEKETGKPYVIEANSAPSLPYLSGRRVSYRQQRMADVFNWMQENDSTVNPFPGIVLDTNWRHVAHPSLTGE